MKEKYFIITPFLVLSIIFSSGCQLRSVQKNISSEGRKGKVEKKKDLTAAHRKDAGSVEKGGKKTSVKREVKPKKEKTRKALLEAPENNLKVINETEGKVNKKALERLDEGELYIIGRIKLLPGLKRENSKSGKVKGESAGNKVFIYLSDRFLDITDSNAKHESMYKAVTLNEHFLLKVKAGDKIYYSGSSIPLNVADKNEAANKSDFLYLPGDKVFLVPENARAVYMGTFRYYRNRNLIDRVSYLDEFKKAKKLLKEVTGNSNIKLERVKQVKQKGLW